MSKLLTAPFPYFGGKRRVAHLVWPRFGDTVNYVEPFAGSLAVLLQRPFPVRTETVNDADCYLSNFWRAVSADPDGVAHYADWPVNEADLHARHRWLLSRDEFRERMMSDPEYFDAKIAGWWVWGLSAWIGGGWCDQNRAPSPKLPHLGDKGKGVHRASLSSEIIPAANRPNLRQNQGVERLRGDDRQPGIHDYMQALSGRLRRTRVCCGDWTRVMGASPTWKIGTTAVFLDPPYNDDAARADVYAVEDTQVSTAVREWAIENGNNQKLRIALCGYEREHGRFMPDSWECVSWDAAGGYGGQRKGESNDNGKQERIWFSPHCLKVGIGNGIVDNADYSALFGGAGNGGKPASAVVLTTSGDL